MPLKVGVIAAKDATVEQLVGLLEAAGQQVVSSAVIPNRTTGLRTQLERWIEEPAIELVIGVASSSMRAALLPLITKRLVGFTGLNEVDGGRCKSTIVILVPKRGITRDLLDASLARVSRELQASREPMQRPPRTERGDRPTILPVLVEPPTASRSRAPTKPPPQPSRRSTQGSVSAAAPAGDSTSALVGRAPISESSVSRRAPTSDSSVSRRTPTTPPPFRVGSKTTPPPLRSEDDQPPDDGPDFIIEHKRPPHVEFEVLVTEINPVRLEQLPVVLSPIATPPAPARSPWKTVGIVALAGAFVGSLLAWRERTKPDTPVTTSSESVAKPIASAAPESPPSSTGPELPSHQLVDVAAAEMELPELIEISEIEAIDVSRPETIEMPPVPVRPPPPDAQRPARDVPSAAWVWSGMADRSHASCAADAVRIVDLAIPRRADVVDDTHARCYPDDGAVAALPIALDRAIIRSAITAVRPAVRRCGKLYPWRGTVTLLIYVRGNGAVSSATVTAAPAVMLGQCIASTVAGARFAPTRKGGAFTYPFKF